MNIGNLVKLGHLEDYREQLSSSHSTSSLIMLRKQVELTIQLLEHGRGYEKGKDSQLVGRGIHDGELLVQEIRTRIYEIESSKKSPHY